MSKAKKKTKEIEYAIKYLYEVSKLSSKQIALELGVSEAMVDGVINQQPEPKEQKISKTQNLMVRHTAAKKTNNVSIMTEAASQLNDELRKNVSNQKSSKFDKSIFRPNG